MRWLVDECIDAGLVSHLRWWARGRLSCRDRARGKRYRIARARAESRIVLTEDKDFGDLVFRRGHNVPGVVLLCIDPARHERKRIRLQSAISRFGESLFGRYTIVEEVRFRSRLLPR